MPPTVHTRSHTRSRANPQVSIPGDYTSDHDTTAIALEPPSTVEKGKVKATAAMLDMQNTFGDMDISSGKRPHMRYEVDLSKYPYPEQVTLPKKQHITSVQDLRAMTNDETEQWIRCWSEILQNDTKIHEHTTQMVDDLNKDKQRYKQKALEARQALSIETDDHKEEFSQHKIQIEHLERTIRELELATEQNHLAATNLSAALPMTATTQSAEDIAAKWRQRGIGPPERLSMENIDEYDQWEHGVREKLETDAPMYLNDRQRFGYIVSQMKGALFRSMQQWIQSKNDNLTMEEIFDEVRHFMGISQRVSNAKNELQTIRMRHNESVNEYYHRIFILWEYAKTPMDERIDKFKCTLTPSISTPLLGQKHTHINELVDTARDIENERKEISNYFPRQERGSASSKPSRNSNYRSPTTNGNSAGARTNGETNPSAKFFPTSEKPAGWSLAWFDPEPRPKRLEDNERDTFARQGRCWACRGSGHRSRNECCPGYKKRLNVARVVEVDSDSRKA